MDLTIIKIGGSVITDKKSGKPKINFGNIGNIAKVLKDFKQPYILIHGAGSFGHPLVKKTGIDKSVISEIQLLAFANTQRLQNQLNCLFCDAFIKKGIPAFPTQASSHAVLERGRLIKMDTEAIAGLLRLKMVPVCYGVPAHDKLWGSAILSGDQIAPYLAKKLGAHKIIEVSDVDGIFTANPKTDRNAKLIPEIDPSNYKDVERFLSGSLAADVTGGMKQKYLELVDAAKTGIICQIIHFKHLNDALANRPVGTVINLKN
ncbi:MAG: isopentenyl phosphate kinase [Minisyncoccales bacterium]